MGYYTGSGIGHHIGPDSAGWYIGKFVYSAAKTHGNSLENMGHAHWDTPIGPLQSLYVAFSKKTQQ